MTARKEPPKRPRVLWFSLEADGHNRLPAWLRANTAELGVSERDVLTTLRRHDRQLARWAPMAAAVAGGTLGEGTINNVFRLLDVDPVREAEREAMAALLDAPMPATWEAWVACLEALWTAMGEAAETVEHVMKATAEKQAATPAPAPTMWAWPTDLDAAVAEAKRAGR